MNRQPKKSTMKAVYMVTMGFLSAILLIGQVGMAALPNIEPVTMLIIVYTLIYRKQVFYIIYTFEPVSSMVFPPNMPESKRQKYCHLLFLIYLIL